ncbi:MULTISPECIES: hypothetical protein [Streptomyces]|uniref:hypothetical protein n=1 Tax=Streptomyces TaxID=1883 RepID=UPI00131D16DF|nr:MULTISPECIES: hypothetical protein [Streptomyces]
MVRLVLVLELVCTAALLLGVALMSVPAALVLGGVLGVVACERATASRETGGGR